MEKYFKPVHCPSDLEKSKSHHCHHYHQKQNSQADRFTSCGYTNTDETSGQCSQQHGHHYQNSISPDEDEFDYDHSNAQVTLSRASSSSLTSSSSSSPSWYTEPSGTDTFTHHHAQRPLHSLSCSNIHEARRLYQLDDVTNPIVFASVKHGSNGNVYSETHRAKNKGKQVFASLDRSHSRSDDGIVKRNERKVVESHLNRSLCFSEEDIMLGVSKGPKRTVSSVQLPSKGILKNKESQTDIRKAKSMEVLSSRVTKEQSLAGQKEKGPSQDDLQKARENFVQEKLKFSAFLDEITKQVMSPCDLKTLGLNTNKTAGLILNEEKEIPKPQLPPKKHRKNCAEGKEQKHKSKQAKLTSHNPRQQSDPCKFDKPGSYTVRNHHGSPPPHNTHHKSFRKERRPPPSEVLGYGRSGVHLTDGTSTSPELIQPKQRHKPQPAQQIPLSYEQQRVHCCPAAGLGSESSSSKSDSSRTRETVSTATSSELAGYYHSQHAPISEPHQNKEREADHLQSLQEENADLHQNLLQTVVCIENLEAELQNTKDELINVKEKYKSLLESHTGVQVNHHLQDHLHAEAQTLNNERQFMFTRVAQLSADLQEAHKTIAALENINVPNLIKELLEKHLFTSTGAKQQFMSATTAFNHFNSTSRTHCEVEGLSQHDWMSKASASGAMRPTAFSPVTPGLSNTENQNSISESLSPCSTHFGAPDANTAFYNKMAAGVVPAIQPLCVKPLLGSITTDTSLPNVQLTGAGGDSCAGQQGVKVVHEEQAVVTALTAQQILNDFMQQLQVQKQSDRDSAEHRASETPHDKLTE